MRVRILENVYDRFELRVERLFEGLECEAELGLYYEVYLPSAHPNSKDNPWPFIADEVEVLDETS